MSAVSLDDAWSSVEVPLPVETMGVREAQAEADAAHDANAAAARAAAKTKQAADAKAMQRLCTEITRLRQQIGERDGVQNVALFVGLGLIVVLLVVLLQSYWKLDHAMQCVLWYNRR